MHPADLAGLRRALLDARDADVVVKASGVGVFDRELDEAVLDFRGPRRAVVYWDVDAPATLRRVRVLVEHTYDQRGRQAERLLEEAVSGRPTAAAIEAGRYSRR